MYTLKLFQFVCLHYYYVCEPFQHVRHLNSTVQLSPPWYPKTQLRGEIGIRLWLFHLSGLERRLMPPQLQGSINFEPEQKIPLRWSSFEILNVTDLSGCLESFQALGMQSEGSHNCVLKTGKHNLTINANFKR